MTDFTELINLASENLGGAVLYANDEFFAPKENLLKPGAPIFIEGKYTDLGKWMDGWETRRRRSPRQEEKFDWCIVRLGLAGIIHVCANRQANPFDLVGTEINVIAAVVLGGAKITGGTGTVLGTILGVLLIVVINSVLVLVGIPSTWQRLVVGVFILLAAGFFVTRQRKR